MHLTLSTCCQALFLLIWCGPAYAGLVMKKRDVCVNDDFLLSFVEYPSDTVPFCKVYLGIEDVTTTVVWATSYTTTIETATTINTVVQTTTVPAFTQYGTTPVVQLGKRGPQPTDAALAIKDLSTRDNSPQNSAIISGVSSACSCLHITPNTVTVSATAHTTRTEQAIDYQKVIDFVTVTGGTTTVLATSISSPSVDTSSAPTPWDPTTIPTTPLFTGTIYSTSTPLTTVSTIITISTSTDLVSPIMNTSSGFSTSPPSQYSTSGPISIPTSSAISGTVIPSLNSTFIPRTGSTTAPPTESSSVSMETSSSFPTTPSGTIPTIPTMPNLTTLTYSLSSKSSFSIPTSSAKASISGSPTYAPSNVTLTSKPPHTIPANATSTTSGLPEANPTAAGCPAIDGSIFTYSNQQFLVICNTDFGGSTTIGLDEPNFHACVQECAITNDGFSSARCRGVTFFPNTTGADCYLKTPAAVAAPEDDPTAVSALLINATLPISSNSTSTPSTTPWTSMNYSSTAGPTGPSGISSFFPSLTSNFSTSAGRTGLSSSKINKTSATTSSSITPLTTTSNSSFTASITPSPSFNSSNIASMTPSVSYNSSFTLNATGTEFRSAPVPTNSTLCASPTGIVISTSVTVITSISTVSVTTTIPWWKF